MKSNLPASTLALMICVLSVTARGGEDGVASARQIGIYEGALRYCSSLDPVAAGSLREKINQLTGNLSPEQLAALHQSSDYLAGFSSVEQFTAKIDEHNARRFCAESAARAAGK